MHQNGMFEEFDVPGNNESSVAVRNTFPRAKVCTPKLGQSRTQRVTANPTQLQGSDYCKRPASWWH